MVLFPFLLPVTLLAPTRKQSSKCWDSLSYAPYPSFWSSCKSHPCSSGSEELMCLRSERIPGTPGPAIMQRSQDCFLGPPPGYPICRGLVAVHKGKAWKGCTSLFAIHWPRFSHLQNLTARKVKSCGLWHCLCHTKRWCHRTRKSSEIGNTTLWEPGVSGAENLNIF